MKVCIAEKPSVAKEIASVLGAKTRKDGYFEGNGYQVTWTFGHLCTLKEPQDYHEELKFWNLNTLPIIPPKFGIKLIQNKGVKEQFNTIKKLVNAADEVINCGDAGQEGELIQRWVLQHAGCKKPTKRLWISSLTEEAIRGGFKQLKPAEDYDRLYWAGSSRAIGDWLLGINATRLYTLKYGGKGLLLSIGRVQTPLLAMIVLRHKETEAFSSTKFWELKTTYRDVIFASEKGKIQSIEEAKQFTASIKDSIFTIISFEKKEGKEFSPKLFDLTSLQVECNKKLGLGADETLKIAQTLYERKFITYPRVDTQFLSDDIYPTIGGILKSMTGYTDLVKPLLNEPIRKSKAVFNDKKITDHHAIIPTNITAKGLGSSEQQVYEAIAKRFIANFYPPCEVSKTTVIGKAVDIEFKATGRQLLAPGWRVVYGTEKPDDDEDKKEGDDEASQLLPDFIEGENGPHVPFLEEKQTSPPKPYTEATLLRAMETAGKQVDDEELRELMKENGIGRPSTRANIIQTLYKRQYIRKERKNIIATTTGIQLIDTIQNELLKSVELTGAWEKKIRDIELGKFDVRQLMVEMRTMVSDLVREVKYSREISKIEIEEKKRVSKKEVSKEITCPKCKKARIVKGKNAFGCSDYKAGCRFVIPFDFKGKKLTDSQLKSIIGKGKSSLIKGFELDGNSCDGVVVLNKNFELELISKEEQPLQCPKCKEGTMVKGKRAYGCNRYNLGCRFIIPFEFQNKILTTNQLETIIRKGRSQLIKELNGRITINKNFDVELVPNSL